MNKKEEENKYMTKDLKEAINFAKEISTNLWENEEDNGVSGLRTIVFEEILKRELDLIYFNKTRKERGYDTYDFE